MRYSILPFSLYFLILIGCTCRNETTIANFETLCEMVSNGAKPIALSTPMTASEIDDNWDDFELLAKKSSLKIYREREFPVTSLWPSELTNNKEVVFIYNSPRMIQYQQFKDDLKNLEPIVAARRFGKLLGYSPEGINKLLMKNTSYKTLSSFGVTGQTTHLYYGDIQAAQYFYEVVLGLQVLETNQYRISENGILHLHVFDDKHPMSQSQSTAVAFLTDQLPQWYNYLQKREIQIKYTYKPRDGGPHDGFVAIDPGGYLLEFEQFKQHPENELFMAYLQQNKRIETRIDSLNFYGSITWTYHNDLLKMQSFYEEVLGFELVVDQGWAKIYRTASSTFVGLVDERRGMMDYADEKAVEIEWKVEDDEVKKYFSRNDQFELENETILGPELYRYRIR